METITALYRQHIAILQKHVLTILERQQLDALLIHSGEPLTQFLDDRPYPFKVNPHFKAWIPVTDIPYCWLLVDGVNKPKLWFYAPVDYWHVVNPLPNDFWTKEIDIYPLRRKEEIKQFLPSVLQRMGYIGESVEQALNLGVSKQHINPKAVLDYLHYHRGYKTDYELACLREAQKVAVTGHKAAFEAFLAGMSEFDINMAYLMATGQRDTDVPYGNIVALNQHAATLHYTELDTSPPDKLHSFLLDAGAEYHGYVADLTRTYSAKNDNDFASLIKSLNTEQQALIASIKPGVSFTEYHVKMHSRIARLLKEYELVINLSEDALVEQGMTTAFLPHGLGHLLGLQVHDVAGFMQDEFGTEFAAPVRYPHLRCTRILQPGMVITIEPGIYFIESLLAPWRIGEHSRHFNWMRIDAMKSFGGIRIEDNIVIHEKRVENMTRDLGLA